MVVDSRHRVHMETGMTRRFVGHSRAAVAARLLAVACVTLPAGALAGPPAEIPVRALFANPEFSAPELSDDGKTIALVYARGDRLAVLTRPLAGGGMVPLVRFDDPDTRLTWLAWANDHRLLVSAHARDVNAVGMRSRVTRLYGVDRD